MSIDNTSFENFHSKCDKIKENVVIVESENGIKFGGYYPNCWESLETPEYFICEDVVLFNINNKEIFKTKKKCHYNIIKSKSFGPNFSNDFSFINNNMSICHSEANEAFLENNKLALNQKKDFKVKEIEVFQIIYEGLEEEQKKGFSNENIVKKIENYFICECEINEKNQKKSILLFNDKYDKEVSKLIIENEKVPLTNYYKFDKVGKYSCKFFFNNNLTSGYLFFNNCCSLTSLNLSNFNTNNVKDMGWMFYGCKGLTSLNLSNFNTTNVTNMRNMFNGFFGLTSLNLSNFNTNSFTNMECMFYDFKHLTYLNL